MKKEANRNCVNLLWRVFTQNWVWFCVYSRLRLFRILLFYRLSSIHTHEKPELVDSRCFQTTSAFQNMYVYTSFSVVAKENFKTHETKASS